MRNYKTLTKIKILTIILLLFAVTSCKSEKPVKEVYIAEVGNSKLTQKELEKHLGSNVGITKYKDEFVRDWVEKEILAQISIENKLLTENNYTRIIENSKRELGASIAVADYLKSYKIEISEAELKEYFNVNEEDYNFSDDAYILNLVSFSNEESAIRFRNNAIIDGWDKAVDRLVEDDELLESKQDKIFKLSEIQSRRISRVLQKLFNSEISLVIETELNNFVVVQQIDKINQNSIPNFKYVKNDVYKSFLILKQKEIIRNYLDSLLTQKNIKIY
jgi:hypothetical protein